jgi:hypothetical protein
MHTRHAAGPTSLVHAACVRCHVEPGINYSSLRETTLHFVNVAMRAHTLFLILCSCIARSSPAVLKIRLAVLFTGDITVRADSMAAAAGDLAAAAGTADVGPAAGAAGMGAGGAVGGGAAVGVPAADNSLGPYA